MALGGIVILWWAYLARGALLIIYVSWLLANHLGKSLGADDAAPSNCWLEGHASSCPKFLSAGSCGTGAQPVGQLANLPGFFLPLHQRARGALAPQPGWLCQEYGLAGAPMDEIVPGMRAHLEGCPACREEHESLMSFLLAS